VKKLTIVYTICKEQIKIVIPIYGMIMNHLDVENKYINNFGDPDYSVQAASDWWLNNNQPK